MRFNKSSAAAIAASIPVAAAQTFTSCNPLQKTCPADTGLSSASYSADFTQGSSAASSWSVADGTTLNYGSNGAEFTISTAGQAPTVSSDFYIFFGHVDVTMKAAPGTGIVSSIVLESDDLDEIDWEFLGGDSTTVETNFFGKGNTTVYNRATYINVAQPQTEFHTYSVDWTSERLEFLIDGAVVRTIPYSDPIALGGANYPQTPMRVKLGNWAGGGPGEPEGTVSWAGGSTDFSQGPFTMYVKSINIQNYNPGSSYVYSDNSGSYQSIKVVNGSSSGSSSSGTSAATGSSSGATTAPTSSVTVAPLTGGAGVVASKTSVISSYSTNTAAISSLNSGSTSAANSTSPSTTAPTTSSSVDPATNSGASTQVMAISSLLTVAAAFLLL